MTLKVGNVVIPLCVRWVSKQGRANTEKPTLLVEMMNEITAFFSLRGIAITDYPVTFDSWYGSQPLVETLEQIGFRQILVHAKSNYDPSGDNIMALSSSGETSSQLFISLR